MNVSYKRTSNKNYMIIEGEDCPLGFETSMFLENKPASLLESHTMEINGYIQYWYDITGKKSLRDFFDQEGITKENLKSAFFGIQKSLLSLAEYLIGEDHLYLTVDTIFFDQKTHGGIYLCFCPLSLPPHTDQLQSIAQHLITTVDHHNPEATKLCYDMYGITEQNRFSLSDFIGVLDEDCANIFESREPSYEPGVPKEITEEDIRQVADDIGEDCFTEESDTPNSFFRLIKHRFTEWKENLSSKREELFPEDEYLKDIEFDEVIPREEPDTQTVLLAENPSACCGKLIHDTGDFPNDFYISHTPFRIGSKSGGNDAVINSPAVSRYHAKIIRKDGVYYLIDLNSTNGTFLNGKILNYNESVPLKSMDTISFADVMYHII